MTIAAGKHLHAATADDIVFYIPLWCLTAIATIAVCLNIRHNFFQRTQPLARADCHGLCIWHCVVLPFGVCPCSSQDR